MGLYLIAADTLLPYGSLWNLAQGLLGLGLVIFVHELGHFLVAKACGVKCEKFYIGFDPPMPLGLPSALWKYKWGETEYGLGVIPLGGYVKMLGQDDNPQNAAAEAERIRIAKENPDGDGDFEIDPRSYPAKTVPQRMAIISAGVIMNLIFAVIFAVVAYNLGVKYTPAMVGSTVPGDTAWKNGIQPGDNIVQFGKDGRRDEQFRFIDLRFQVIKVDVDEPMDVLIRHEDGTEDWKTLFPKERKKVNSGLATIGVRSASATRLADYDFATRSVVKRTDLEEGDVIKALVINSQRHEVTNGFDIDRLLINNPGEEIEIVVDRFEDPEDPTSASQQVSVMVPPLPAWEFGLRMKLSPIDAVQLGSPAEATGFKKGDLLTHVNGEPIVNPMAIDSLLMDHVGSEIPVTVIRDGQSLELKVTPREREMLGLSGRRGGAISTECLGVAFYLEDEIESVVPGSPADKAGLKPGDKLRSADFSIAKAASDEQKEKIKSLNVKKLDFTEFPRSWP
ncbi:MAG: site-2 protease family protein, partial [Planctomycetota bacterium]